NNGQVYSVTLTSACAGTYSVTSTNATLTVNPTVQADISGTLSYCAGNSTVLSANTASAYSWIPGGATTQSITVTAPGTYRLTTTDVNGCITSDSVTVTEFANPTLSASSNSPVCEGAALMLTSTASGSGLAYSWSGPVSYTSSSPSPTILSASTAASGTYSVSVTDANGCTASASTAVSVLGPPSVSISSAKLLNCNQPTVTATAAAVPYSGQTITGYLWSTGATTQSITISAAGIYTVTVTQSGACSATDTLEVLSDFSVPTLTASSSDIITCSQMTSTVSVSAVASGTNTITDYLWSNGQTTSSFTAISSGTYSVTVTQSNGCTASVSVTVNADLSVPSVTAASSNPITCSQASTTVSASSTASGSNTITDYSWSNGQTTSSFSTSTAGTYTVTVTQSNGCTSSASVTVVSDGNVPSVTAASSNTITCNQPTTTVSSTATPSGTNTITAYLWSNGQTTSSFATSTAGTYTVTVTQSNGCTATASVTVTAASTLTASASSGSIACFGGSTTVTVTASGGTTPYTGTGSFTRTAGTYTFTVTDANGCTATTSVTVTEPTQVTASASAGSIACFGGSTTVTVSASGGTTPYAGTGSFTRTAGTYNFTVTDANGCTATTSVTVIQPSQITLAFTKTDVTTYGGNNGSATVTASGGTPGYSYLWSNGATTATTTGLIAGTYTVTVTDANGCTRTGSVTINQPSTGTCGPFRSYGPGGWGSPSTSVPGAYLDANFAAAYPTGLQIGSCTRFIQLTSATAVRNFLPTSGTPKQLPPGTLINPTAVSYSNTFAGQLVALNLTITFDALNPSFAPSGVLFRDLIISTGPFVGLTVQQLYNLANTAIGCGGNKTYISNLTTALDLTNNSWKDGIQRNNYLVCPASPAPRISSKGPEAPLLYPNPTSDRIRLSIEMQESKVLELVLFNVTGQLMYKDIIRFDETGIQVIELQLKQLGLSQGIYLLRVTANGATNDFRIILTD
ncbi:MAG: hypothetical protein RL021_354, partial [Bacteroidota bacterium]